MEPKEIYPNLIRLHVLIEASRRPIDTGSVRGSLEDRGLILNDASIRRILREFEGKGYLASSEAHNSRPHIIYTMTPAGRARMRDAKEKIRALIAMFESAGRYLK
jgi:DNA-binding PadR family transcriptional regulator